MLPEVRIIHTSWSKQESLISQTNSWVRNLNLVSIKQKQQKGTKSINNNGYIVIIIVVIDVIVKGKSIFFTSYICIGF